MESLDQEFSSKPDVAHQNGYAPIDITPPAGPPRIPFSTKGIDAQSMPFEWGRWIFTGMRQAELAGEKPKPFSWWLHEASMEFVIRPAMENR